MFYGLKNRETVLKPDQKLAAVEAEEQQQPAGVPLPCEQWLCRRVAEREAMVAQRELGLAQLEQPVLPQEVVFRMKLNVPAKWEP